MNFNRITLPWDTGQNGMTGKSQSATELPNSLGTPTTIRLNTTATAGEKTYIHWIKQYILLQDRRHPGDMCEAQIEQL